MSGKAKRERMDSLDSRSSKKAKEARSRASGVDPGAYFCTSVGVTLTSCVEEPLPSVMVTRNFVAESDSTAMIGLDMMEKEYPLAVQKVIKRKGLEI